MSWIIKATKTENLLKEIEEISGQSADNIDYVNSSQGNISCDELDEKFKFNNIEEFKQKALLFNYKSDWGGSVFDYDLEIVFKDGSWIEPGQYDGTCWLEYKKTPERKEGNK